MKKIVYSASLLLFAFLAACNSADKEPAPAASENDVDAARNFIQAALKSDYAKARTYLLPDSVNKSWMDQTERVRRSDEEKKGLAAASINIHSVNRVVKDSVTIIVFSNSFKNDRNELKVVKQHDNWLVDLKYLFIHDNDSLSAKPIDTISK